MKKWKYLQVTVAIAVDGKRIKTVKTNEDTIFNLSNETPDFKLSDYLMKLGQEGWEMVNAFTWGEGWTRHYYFKRAIE